MADSFYCTENAKTCFQEIDCTVNGTGNNELELSSSLHSQIKQTHRRDASFDNNGSETFVGSVLECEERVKELVEKEIQHLPREDYLERIQNEDLNLRVRRESLDWVWKAQEYYGFGPLTICLSMNYLDRFLSVYQFPMDKTWAVQLLSVACLSLAAKMEETDVPLSIDLQVGDPKFVFEAKTIQRMELLVLSTLKWKMQAITPFSFIDYFLRKITVAQKVSTLFIFKSTQLILSTIKGIDFLEFKPSEIALAVAISISGSSELEPVDIDKTMSSFPYIRKETVIKCIEMIKDFCLMNVNGNSSSIPQSPIGVLDAACLSYKSSEELNVGSCVNSSHNSSDSKRRRPDTTDTDRETFKS